MATNFERVQAIVAKKFKVPLENIRPEATIESLGLDSLDLIELLFEVEEEFHIRVPQDGAAAAALRTASVQDIVDNISKLLAAEAVPQPGAE